MHYLHMKHDYYSWMLQSGNHVTHAPVNIHHSILPSECSWQNCVKFKHEFSTACAGTWCYLPSPTPRISCSPTNLQYLHYAHRFYPPSFTVSILILLSFISAQALPNLRMIAATVRWRQHSFLFHYFALLHLCGDSWSLSTQGHWKETEEGKLS
jgi:hypothetical protein